jgi:hypothetical protein
MVDGLRKTIATLIGGWSVVDTLYGINEIVTHNKLVNAGVSGYDLYIGSSQLTHFDNGFRVLMFATILGLCSLGVYYSGRRGNAYSENQTLCEDLRG